MPSGWLELFPLDSSSRHEETAGVPGRVRVSSRMSADRALLRERGSGEAHMTRSRNCRPTERGRSVRKAILVHLPPELLALLRQPSTCYLVTLMPGGSPQVTQTWVDTDGTHIVINTAEGFVKLANIERDPRVAVAIGDSANSFRYVQVRGRVDRTTEGGAEHIEMLSQKYLGEPYAWFGGRDQVRVILKIEADAISGNG